ncbi:MAG: DUF2752 domain-containing protein [Actinobacteria bacterium]|uniref:Unannotated protein n=1 Tax=freshwater metagenome TaxID=449393 RepID=A0A6J7CT68_9ZZZZ|nr:DUF2752 domain-containing protein [Actinomycetota bacterium]
MTTHAPIAIHDDDVLEQAIVDHRSLGRRLLAPMLVALGAAGTCALVYAVDPNEPGHYPLCPTRALFGIDCPGCGLMRGTHDLLHGNVAGAIDHNVLLIAAVPLVVVLWGRWLNRARTGIRPEVTRRQFRLRHRILIISLIAMLAFGVVRNFVPYLGSGTSGP